jgi:hypothetical protein
MAGTVPPAYPFAGEGSRNELATSAGEASIAVTCAFRA